MHHLRPQILNILASSDLETVSAKRVRRRLESDLGVDLTGDKKEVDRIIAECFIKFTSSKSPTLPPTPSQSQSPEKKDGKEHVKKEDEDAIDDSRRFTKKRKRKDDPDRPKRKAPDNGFNKALTLSPALVSIVDSPSLSRPQVVFLPPALLILGTVYIDETNYRRKRSGITSKITDYKIRMIDGTSTAIQR